MNTLTLNKLRINAFDQYELKDKLLETVASPVDPKIIITLNLDFLRIAENNKDFLNICNNSLWNLPDGHGITLLLSLKYKRKIERITGNDLFPILLDIANTKKLRIALIGSSRDVLHNTRQKISQRYSWLSNNLLCVSPPIDFEKDKQINSKIVDEVTSFQPDIVCVALGCPRQEMWIWQNMNNFKSKINIGVGAVLDYYSGIKKRSPKIFQSLYLEWFWRVLNEPGRLFKRYFILDLPFFLENVIKILTTKFKSS